MAVYRPKYWNAKTGEMVELTTWWYDFWFAGKRYQGSTKTQLKTRARDAEQQQRRKLQDGYTDTKETRRGRIKTVKELAARVTSCNTASENRNPPHSWNMPRGMWSGTSAPAIREAPSFPV